MKPFHRLLILIAAAGLFSGLAVSRSSPRGADGRGSSRQNASRSAGEIPGTAPVSAARVFPPQHSADTLETLAALDDRHLYSRLALWLTEASEADIAAFWNGYSNKEDGSRLIQSLIFVNWTRLNPQAAIAAVGEKYWADVWWAWTCHDPQAAFAAATTGDPKVLRNVFDGIAQFHPEWLREHFNEIPEKERAHALFAMGNWDSDKDPLRTLKLLEENHVEVDAGILKALVREDPWAALDWAKQHKQEADPFSLFNCVDLITSTIASEHPEVLERLLEQTPSGDTKLKMEAALFANLVQSDPAAALEQAKATTIPRTAAERYAAIGLTLVQTDPAQALQIAKSLFAACPDAFVIRATIEYPAAKSEKQITIPGVDDFMNKLMSRQPANCMDLVVNIHEGEEANYPLQNFARDWAQEDLTAYAAWVNQQTDPAVRTEAAGFVMEKLSYKGHYEEALDWAITLDDSKQDPVQNVLKDWEREDQAAPREWLESSNLPADRKGKIRALLDRERDQ
ncbi:MAG: hypothetical protein ABIS50_13630 [Luteolibacter sp.]|uniref:hypothetical protein n=1 Tax=Luteolibacter sp. TaxID=1962973 RepID=UPI003267D8B1